MSDTAEFLTTSQFAALIGAHRQTVWRWCVAGLIPAYRVGGRGDHRIPRAEALAAMRRTGAPAPAPAPAKQDAERAAELERNRLELEALGVTW